MDIKEIKCSNCKFYNDLMLLNECEQCALRRSKLNEIIKFEKNG